MGRTPARSEEYRDHETEELAMNKMVRTLDQNEGTCDMKRDLCKVKVVHMRTQSKDVELLTVPCLSHGLRDGRVNLLTN